MYSNGEILQDDIHFQDHIEHHIPIQVYLDGQFRDIGYVEQLDSHFIKVNQTLYNRTLYKFVSRPGY